MTPFAIASAPSFPSGDNRSAYRPERVGIPTKAALRHIRVEKPRTNHQRPCAAHRKGKKAHRLLSGDTHLVIVENDKSFRYCPSSGAILELAQSDLDRLRQQMGI